MGESKVCKRASGFISNIERQREREGQRVQATRTRTKEAPRFTLHEASSLALLRVLARRAHQRHPRGPEHDVRHALLVRVLAPPASIKPAPLALTRRRRRVMHLSVHRGRDVPLAVRVGHRDHDRDAHLARALDGVLPLLERDLRARDIGVARVGRGRRGRGRAAEACAREEVACAFEERARGWAVAAAGRGRALRGVGAWLRLCAGLFGGDVSGEGLHGWGW